MASHFHAENHSEKVYMPHLLLLVPRAYTQCMHHTRLVIFLNHQGAILSSQPVNELQSPPLQQPQQQPAWPPLLCWALL